MKGVGAATSALALISLPYMPVSAFTAIVMTAPLVVTMLAAVLLKEQVSAVRWLVFDRIPRAWALGGIALILLHGATASWITAREQLLPVGMPEP